MPLRSRSLHRAAPVACSFALAMLPGCGGAPAERAADDAAVDASQADPTTAGPDLGRVHATVRAATAVDPKLRARFEATLDGLAREGGELRTRAAQGAARRPLPRLFAKGAPFADAKATLGVGGHASWTTGWTLRGAAHVPATLVDGRATFVDAFPSTDVVVAASAHAREDWFVLRDPGAPSAFRYHVALGKSVVKGAMEPAGTFALLDATGTAVLRTERPIAIDAAGRRIEGALSWDEATSTLSVGVDARGARYPVVLDPFTGVAAWTLQKTVDPNTYVANASTKPCALGISDFGVGCGNVYGSALIYRQDLGAVESVGGLAGGTGGGYRQWSTRWNPVNKSWEQMNQWSYMLYEAWGAVIAVPGFGYTTEVFGRDTQLFGAASPSDQLYERSASPQQWKSACSPVTGCFTGLAETGRWSAAAAAGGDWRSGKPVTYVIATFGGRNAAHLDDGLGDTCSAVISSSYPYSYYPLICSTPAGSPPPRWGAGGAGTTQGKAQPFQFVIYGGSSSLAAGGARADSWAWDPYAGWSALCGVTGKPACAPGVAVQSVLDFDEVTNQLYMVSSDGTELRTSAFDVASQTWSVLCGGALPSCGIPHRLNYGFAFDRGRHRGILAGGGDETVHPFDTWEMVARGNDCALGCDTGICTDGVCCEQSTCGTCQSCNLAGSLGSCSAVKSADDTDSCPVLTSTCDASGSCRARGGQSCATDAACASGHCTSAGGSVSVCCDVASCPAGQICQIGKGTCIGDLGYACAKGADCASGNCVDGVCCDSACDPSKPCQSCANPGNVGHCSATSGAPTAGRAACPKSASSDASCNQSVCNGSDPTACHYPGSTTTCASGAKCSAGVEADPAGCDGAGACATTTKPCNAYACGAATCKTTCAAEADCAAGYWCSGGACAPKTGLGSPCASASQCSSGLACTDGVCCGSASCPDGTCNGSKPGTCTLSLGKTCSAGAQCASGLCVDGVCCNTACGGTCEACDVGGSLGVCTPVIGAPAAGHGACNAGSGPGDCAATTCNGLTRSACAHVSGNACGAGCAGASTATTAGTCDGTGKCVGSATVQCAPYTCAASACKTTCAASADCTAGNYCDATGHCVARLGNGTTCGDGGQCSSGNCVDGVCCASASCPTGGSCNDPSNLGLCSIKLGQAAVAGVPCASKGVAADGVCCNAACNGLCESCNVAGLAGVCSPIPNGGQPASGHGACPSSGTDPTCKQSYCDGVQRAQCKYPDGKVACGSASCAAGTYVSGGVCSGGGACVPTTSGGCAPYVCGATACKTTCGNDADCSAGAFCDPTGHCAYKANVGNPCATDAACGAGLWCTNNICCTAQTCGAGACVNRGTEKGVCKAGNGSACAIDGDCVSSHCVDGVCCNGACTESCGSCKVAGFEGVCTPVIGAPTGGRPPCAGDGSTCGSKTCTGASLSCVDPPVTTPCGAQACDTATNTELDPGFCGAAGKCSMTSRPCGYFLCAGTACKTICASDGDCVSTAFCAADGSCQLKGALGQPCDPKLAGACGLQAGKQLGCQNGVCCDDPQCEAHGGFCGGTHPGVCLARNNQACGADAECSSGHCADKDATSGKGVCCDGACDGVCESCTTTGTPGTCAPIAGTPAKGHGACPAGAGDACSGSVCDGKDGKSCAGKPGAETVCQAASCAAGKANPPITCNGSGSCPTVTPVYCDNFRTCHDATSCDQGPCKGDADCADGYACDAATGKCREKTARCKDGDPTIAIDVAGVEVPCAPYLCDTNGTCKQGCTSSADCAGGYVCDTAAGQCATPSATTSTDAGGCDAGGTGAGGGAGIGVAAIALALGAARRRRRAA